MTTFTVFLYTSKTIGTMPMVLGLMNYKKLDTRYKVFVLYLVAAIVSETLSEYCKIHYQNALMVYKYFNLVEFIFFVWFLAAFTYKKSIKYLAIGIVIVSIILWFYCYFLSGFHIAKANSFMRAYNFLLYIFFACNALIFIADANPKNIARNSDVWLVMGILLFTAFSFTLVSSIQIIQKGSIELSQSLWNIHSVGNIILNICFTISLWFKLQKASYTIQ